MTKTSRLAIALMLAVAVQAHSIKHVIVLMQENRSFDHLLGFMKREFPELDGLTGTEWNPLNRSDPNTERIYVHDEQPYRIDVDPAHGVSTTANQIFGVYPVPYPRPEPLMNGFVEDYVSRRGTAEEVMGSFKPEDIPVWAELVREFAVFDRWFCGVAGPTQPNRFFMHAASSDGLASNDVTKLALGIPVTPIYNSVVDSGYSWANYFQEVPSSLLMKWPRRPQNWSFGHYSTFKDHVLNGTLPTVSFIDPRYFDLPGAPQNDDHPGGADLRNGMLLIKDMYETLRASPIWNDLLWIITFDEHGGFHDHVPTPLDIPNPDGKVSEDPVYEFDRSGVRVPTIVVSPWVEKGTIINRAPPAQRPYDNSEYEAASIPATIKKLFNLKADFLTERDAWASTFEHILDIRTTPRTDCPTTLPEVPDVDSIKPDSPTRLVTDLQEEWVLMASGLTGGAFQDGHGWTEPEAAFYVKEQVCEFFGQCMYAGADSYDGKYCTKGLETVPMVTARV